MYRRSHPALLALVASLLAAACAWSAEPFDTHHTLALRAGLHNYFPDNSPNEGTRPDDDAVVTDDEWLYVWDEAYRIQDYDSATIELGYEYKFLRWFGLGLDLGIYGKERDVNIRVSGFEVRSRSSIEVFHMDLSPRFHWLTRWTDLYGGPVVGYYTARSAFKIDVTYGPHAATYKDDERGDAIGWGLLFGFELRIIRNFGIALEDRLVVALVDEFAAADEGPASLGGNVLTLSAVAHF